MGKVGGEKPLQEERKFESDLVKEMPRARAEER